MALVWERLRKTRARLEELTLLAKEVTPVVRILRFFWALDWTTPVPERARLTMLMHMRHSEGFQPRALSSFVTHNSFECLKHG